MHSSRTNFGICAVLWFHLCPSFSFFLFLFTSSVLPLYLSNSVLPGTGLGCRRWNPAEMSDEAKRSERGSSPWRRMSLKIGRRRSVRPSGHRLKRWGTELTTPSLALFITFWAIPTHTRCLLSWLVLVIYMFHGVKLDPGLTRADQSCACRKVSGWLQSKLRLQSFHLYQSEHVTPEPTNEMWKAQVCSWGAHFVDLHGVHSADTRPVSSIQQLVEWCHPHICWVNDVTWGWRLALVLPHLQPHQLKVWTVTLSHTRPSLPEPIVRDEADLWLVRICGRAGGERFFVPESQSQQSVDKAGLQLDRIYGRAGHEWFLFDSSLTEWSWALGAGYWSVFVVSLFAAHHTIAVKFPQRPHSLRWTHLGAISWNNRCVGRVCVRAHKRVTAVVILSEL